MMNFLLKITFALVFFSAFPTYASTKLSGYSEQGRWLITARIGKARLQELNSGDAFGPSVYTVSLVEINVVQGHSKKFPHELQVRIKANQIERMVGNKKIFAVIDFEKRLPVVRYWETIIPIACVPKELIEPKYEQRYFSEDWNAPNQKCTFVDRYQKADNEKSDVKSAN